MQGRGEQPGAAAEIDDPAGGPSRDQRDQIVEGLLALGAKTLVLRWDSTCRAVSASDGPSLDIGDRRARAS